MWEWLLVPLAYLMGSISSAVIICRCLKLPDPREHGSMNPGATNVLRFGGKKAAAMTLIGDVFKGLIPVLFAQTLGADSTVTAVVGLFAFAGHLYPVFFNFKGGKGIATALGALTGFAWPIGIALIATWLIIAFTFKLSSLAALMTAIINPLYVWWFTDSRAMLIAGTIISLLAIWRHRSNIQRLFEGKEGKIGN